MWFRSERYDKKPRNKEVRKQRIVSERERERESIECAEVV